MRSFTDSLYQIAVTLWVGGLWAIGFIAAPVLFAYLEDRTLAGALAGRAFSVVAWVGIACAAYLIVFLLARRGWRAVKSSVFWIVLFMLGMTVAGHFGIQPILAELKAQALPREVMESVVRSRFATWHGVASGLYLAQSLLGVALVVIQGRGLR